MSCRTSSILDLTCTRGPLWLRARTRVSRWPRGREGGATRRRWASTRLRPVRRRVRREPARAWVCRPPRVEWTRQLQATRPRGPVAHDLPQLLHGVVGAVLPQHHVRLVLPVALCRVGTPVPGTVHRGPEEGSRETGLRHSYFVLLLYFIVYDFPRRLSVRRECGVYTYRCGRRSRKALQDRVYKR